MRGSDGQVMSENTVPRPKSRREILTDDIRDQITRAIREELTDAAKPLTSEDCEAIETEILCHSSLVLDAVSTADLTSEGALLSHILNVRADAGRLIRLRSCVRPTGDPRTGKYYG
jgi:hypothetical protein